MWNNLTPQFQELLRYGLQGGKSVDEFMKVYSDVDYSGIDLTQEENQKYMIREYYKRSTPHTDEKIERMIQRLETLGDLQLEAEDARDYLEKAMEKEQQQFQENQKKANEEALSKQKKEREAVVSALENNNNIKGRRKASVRNFLFNIVERDNVLETEFNRVLDHIFETPEHLAQLADVLVDYDYKTGLNLTRFTKLGQTQAATNFQKSIQNRLLDVKSNLRGHSPSPNATGPNWGDILDAIQ